MKTNNILYLLVLTVRGGFVLVTCQLSNAYLDYLMHRIMQALM
jgi:hypothetical protein